MIRKTIFAVATAAAIGAAALIPTAAFAGGGKGGRMGGGMGWRLSRRPWLLGARLRRHRGDRFRLLAMGARPRASVRLLLMGCRALSSSAQAKAPVSWREAGAAETLSHRNGNQAAADSREASRPGPTREARVRPTL